MSPRVPQVWKAVAQENQRPGALFGHVEMNFISRNRAMRNAAGGLRGALTRCVESANSCRADTANEFTPLHHSMTSSARATSDGGTARPSVLAVFMLMTNSNVVGCNTGRSAGFAPLRIFPT